MVQSKTNHIYYPLFDFLRFSLAIIVVLGHDGIFSKRFNLWEHSGNFAVQIFFALSGFLIGDILLKTQKDQLTRFYFNRAIRIWIPYFVALALVITAGLLHDNITAKWFEFIIYKSSFVYNLFGPPQLALFRDAMPLQGSSNHFWSVNAEEQFYLLAPLILILANKKWGQHVLTWLIIALIAWLTKTYASIVLGVLSVILVKEYGQYHKHNTLKLAFVFTISLCIFGFYKSEISYELIAPICAICIILLLAVKGPKNKLGAFLGGISYPLYLNHWIGVFIANIVLKPLALELTLSRVVFEVIINLLIASILYLMIEKPMLAKRNLLYNNRRGLIVCIIAYAMVFVGVSYGIYMTNLI